MRVSPRKASYLFLALLLPGLLFVFLKYFGKNQFDIPVYYNEGVALAAGDCDRNYPVPYVLADSSLQKLGWNGSRVTLFVVKEHQIERNLARIRDEFGDQFSVIGLDSADASVRSCLFLIKDTSSVVMVDDERRIRGYYDLTTRKETDRLSLEMNIMLKKY